MGRLGRMEQLKAAASRQIDVSYRLPMRVKEAVYYSKAKTRYPVCPSCQISFEREYINFCDNCGQCLNWEDYDRALIRLLR